MSEIKEFDEAAKCSKCGYDHIDTTYKPAATEYDLKSKRARTEWGFPVEEYLLRKCPRCGFAWPETVKS